MKLLTHFWRPIQNVILLWYYTIFPWIKISRAWQLDMLVIYINNSRCPLTKGPGQGITTGYILPGGATRMARGGIRLVHGLTKSTLITYYSGMKKDPKYVLLHAFFSICLSCSFQNLSIWPKTHPFFQFCTFLHPKRCTRVQCLVLKNNPNYVNFWTSLIPPLTIQVAPPGHFAHRLWFFAPFKSIFLRHSYRLEKSIGS